MTFAEYEARLRLKAERLLVRVGAESVAEVRQLISVPVPVPYQRATPGAPPRKDTGRLRASVGFLFDKSRLVVTVYAGAKYAKFLEHGTRRMGPHPFLRHTVAAVARRVLSRFWH